TVCTNEPIQFTGSGTGTPTAYNWKFVGASPSQSTLQNPTVSFFAAGQRFGILTVTTTLGTSEPDTFRMSVVQSPPAQIINGSSASICKGDSLLLSATNQSILTYKWDHTSSTSRQVYVSDSLTTRVTTTSTVTGCSTTSPPFTLSIYPEPSISISSSTNQDTFCGNYNLTLTASGNNIDSVYWYRNGVHVRTTGTLSTMFSGTQSAMYTAMAKSVNACNSPLSNEVNLVVVPKLFPSNILISETTGTINMRWTKPMGISRVEYDLVDQGLMSTIGDTALSLGGLNP